MECPEHSNERWVVLLTAGLKDAPPSSSVVNLCHFKVEN